jgi:hypothetical protein
MSGKPCRECDFHRRRIFITNDQPYHECKAMGRIICYGDKLPKTHPRWCSLVINGGDRNA